MVRVATLAWLLVLAGCSRPLPEASPAEWQQRLVLQLDALLADPAFDDSQYAVVIGVTTLANLGEVEQATQLALAHAEAGQDFMFWQALVRAQLRRGDIAGARDAAERITKESARSYSESLIAAHEAARGDSAEALRILDQIADETIRRDVLERLIELDLRNDNWSRAEALLPHVVDESARASLEESLRRRREEPSLGDPDYADRIVARKREWAIEFDEQDEAAVRLVCRARVALHQQDSAELSQAMRAIEAFEQPITAVGNMRLIAAQLYLESGDRAAAARSFRKVLKSWESLVQGDDGFASLAPAMMDESSYEGIVEVLPTEEVEGCILVFMPLSTSDNGGSTGLVTGLVRALAARGERQVVERIYSRCQTSWQRYHIAVGVLEAMAKSPTADPGDQ